MPSGQVRYRPALQSRSTSSLLSCFRKICCRSEKEEPLQCAGVVSTFNRSSWRAGALKVHLHPYDRKHNDQLRPVQKRAGPAHENTPFGPAQDTSGNWHDKPHRLHRCLHSRYGLPSYFSFRLSVWSLPSPRNLTCRRNSFAEETSPGKKMKPLARASAGITLPSTPFSRTSSAIFASRWRSSPALLAPPMTAPPAPPRTPPFTTENQHPCPKQCRLQAPAELLQKPPGQHPLPAPPAIASALGRLLHPLDRFAIRENLPVAIGVVNQKGLSRKRPQPPGRFYCR